MLKFSTLFFYGLLLWNLSFGGSLSQGHADSSSPSPLPLAHLMVTQIVAHPALDAVRQGALDALKEGGYDSLNTLKVTYENAQGNLSIAAQIAHKFAGQAHSGEMQAILALSTPSAQTILTSVGQKVPIVFGAVTDPVAAHLVKSLDHPGTSVTGVTDRPPIRRQFTFMRQLLAPKKLKTLGVLYNSGEANSLAALEEIKEAASELGISLVESVAINSAQVGQAAHHLLGQVDAIYIPPDNTIVSGLDAVIKVGQKHHVPVFAADVMLVDRGLGPMIGFDYYETGRQAGKILVRIFQGENPRDIPVQAPEKLILKVNLKSAQAMGIHVSPEILKIAQKQKGRDRP